MDSRSFSVELGYWIPPVIGILDSYSCIPDSKAQDSGFHKQKFLRFGILQAKISGIPESGFPYMGRNKAGREEGIDVFCKTPGVRENG